MTQLGTDLIVRKLFLRQQPLTKEAWLELAYPGEIPDNWQLETDMPRELLELEDGESLSLEDFSSALDPEEWKALQQEKEDIHWEAVRRSKVRQMSKGLLTPTPVSSQSPNNLSEKSD